VYPVKNNIYVVGFGKAVLGMARAAEDVLGGHIQGGVLSIPRGQRKALEKKGKS
jgi:glycerate kinase